MKSETRSRVYALAVEGTCCSKIAVILGISHNAVKRHLAALCRDGNLICINPGGRPTLYNPGPVPFEGGATTPPNPPPGMVEPALRVKANTHHRKHYFTVVVKPKADLEAYQWTRRWTGSKGDRHYHMETPRCVLSPGNYVVPMSITYHQGKDKSSLQVNLPKVEGDAAAIKAALRDRWDEAQRVANWFAKEFKCSLGLPREPEDAHIAIPPSRTIDPQTLQLAASLGITTEHGVRVEASEGPLEFEFNEDQLDRLLTEMDIHALARNLHETDQVIVRTTEEAVNRLDLQKATLIEILRLLASHQNQLKLLSQLLLTTPEEVDQEPRPPTTDDEDWMYQ